MKKILVFIFAIFFISITGNSQVADPQFTQFYSVPLYLAPSFAGATQQHRVSATYRNQWAGIPGNFNTYTVAYDHYFNKFNSGLGFLVVRDAAGSAKLGFTYFSVLYSYDFLVLKTFHVRPGISFIYNRIGIEFAKLVFGDQFGPDGVVAKSGVELPPSIEKRGNIDGNFSVLVYSEKFWQGVTVDHLLKPNMSFYGDKELKPVRYTFYGGTKLISKGRLLKPADESISLAYQMRFQGDYKQLDIGLYWYNSPLVLGIWYRGLPVINAPRGDALAFLAGLKIYDMSFAYSYDFTISNLINSSGGAHEVTLIYEFRTTHRKKYHAIPCPEF